MAPTTRRESRLSGIAPDTEYGGMSLEQILENFEQCTSAPRRCGANPPVRRKHMAQNRDVIRANTLAQMRIRELETRVSALEEERTQQDLHAARQTAHIRRIEYALECVRVGWETMGRGLDEAGVSTSSTASVTLGPPPERQPSMRVELAPGAAAVRTYAGRHVELPHAVIPEDAEEEAAALQDAEPRAPEPEDPEPAAPAPASPDTPRAPLLTDECPPSVTRRRPSRRQSAQFRDLGRSPVEAGALHEDATVDADEPAPESVPAEPLAEPRAQLPSTDSIVVDPTANTPAPDATPPSSRKRSRSSRVPPPEPAVEEERPMARRARKSVNYALPKLNTKMRKPDPEEADGAEPTESRQETHRTSSRRGSRASRSASAEPDAGAAEQAGHEQDAERQAEPHGSAEPRKEAAPPPSEPPAEPRKEAPLPPSEPPAERRKEAAPSPSEPPAERRKELAPSAPEPPAEPAAPAPPRPETPAVRKPTPRVANRSGTPHVKRQLPPSVRSSAVPSRPAGDTPLFTPSPRTGSTPFVPSRARPLNVSTLQQHSAQQMPSWASSLLNLSSPEPPRKSGPRATPSKAQDEKENAPLRAPSPDPFAEAPKTPAARRSRRTSTARP